MTKQDIISQSLGMAPINTKQSKIITTFNIEGSDYEYARRNLYDVIEKSNSALEDIMDIAKQSESPRAYEVVTNLIKTMVDANKDLLQLAKTKKEIEKEDLPDQKNITNNNLVLTTGDFLKMIKNSE